MKNLNTVEATMRMGGGLMMLGYGIMKGKGWLVMAGAMGTASGALRYCPGYHVMGINGCDKKKRIMKHLKHMVQSCGCDMHGYHDYDKEHCEHGRYEQMRDCATEPSAES